MACFLWQCHFISGAVRSWLYSVPSLVMTWAVLQLTCSSGSQKADFPWQGLGKDFSQWLTSCYGVGLWAARCQSCSPAFPTLLGSSPRFWLQCESSACLLCDRDSFLKLDLPKWKLWESLLDSALPHMLPLGKFFAHKKPQTELAMFMRGRHT